MKFKFTLPLHILSLHIIFLMGSYILGIVPALTQQTTPCTNCPPGPYSKTCNNCFVTTVKKLTCNCMRDTYEYELSSVIIDDSTTDCNESDTFTNCDGQLTCGTCPTSTQVAPENKKEKKNNKSKRNKQNGNRSNEENKSESSASVKTTKKKGTRKKKKKPEEKRLRKEEEL